MSVDLQYGTAAHIPNSVGSINEYNDFSFLSAIDYFHYTNGYIHHDTQVSEHLQNPHAKTSRVAVVLGYFDGQDYISDQLQSILNQTHSSVHIYLCLFL